MANDKNTHDHDHHHHVINISAVHLSEIERKIATPPSILSKSAGRSTCSIFRVPKSFTDVNGKLYQPQLISIGPLHHGVAHLEMMEEHKYHYLGLLLARTRGLSLAGLLDGVGPLVGPARECYSEAVNLGDEEMAEMMVVDGCFVIELFRKVAKRVRFEPDDPIASMSWIFPALLRDLHRLENQIPYFVLQRLFDLTGKMGDGGKDDDHVNDDDDGGPTLATLCLEFFNFTLQRPHHIIWKYKDLQPKHLLDLLRSSFITPELDPKESHQHAHSTPIHVILSVSKLRQAGIHLRPGKSETFLAVRFKKSGVIEMPTFTFDDFMSSLIANCVAYEQCHKNSTTYFTTYATLMDCLVNTAKDVEYLCDKNIMENYFGTDAEIATFVNNIGKDVAFDIDDCYLAQLFNVVNSYYRNSWHVHWASFKYTYFSTPWSFVSAVAAFVLLVLTVLQTLYTMIPYYNPF